MERTGFNPQKIYDALAQIMGEKYNAEIKFTVTRKDEKKQTAEDVAQVV